MIDLRSDTVTRPTEEMRAAMAAAEVGDDVFGDDPTVARLEARAAEMFGKETAVFLPSGTQSNLCAMMSHCARGDEFIVSQAAHAYRYEGGGAAVLGSIQPQPIEPNDDGTMPLDKIAAAIKPIDDHFARTRLIALENTTGGIPLPAGYVNEVLAIADAHGLGKHLDGARIFNASVATKTPVDELARGFDTVSVCLSKGLGAPAGSVLVGCDKLITRARRWRKMLGGGMRQAGVLAAAGLYALEHGPGRLHEDHENARALAEGLSSIDDLTVFPEVPSNMVFVRLPSGVREALLKHLEGAGVVLYAPGDSVRLVTHRDVSSEDIDATVRAFAGFFVAQQQS